MHTWVKKYIHKISFYIFTCYRLIDYLVLLFSREIFTYDSIANCGFKILMYTALTTFEHSLVLIVKHLLLIRIYFFIRKNILICCLISTYSIRIFDTLFSNVFLFDMLLPFFRWPEWLLLWVGVRRRASSVVR